jgi:hypothetical protein
MNCGANRTCNETADQCQCVGCQIGGTCFANGARNPSNACQVCDPNRNATAFSVSAGAACGSGPTECSGQDTCNAQGQCIPNNLANGTACSSVARGNCQNGACVAATLPTGATCQQNNDCASGRCETWFRDRDGDGFGTTDDVQRICGSQSGASLPPQGYVASAGDCCDLGGSDAIVTRDIFPGQTRFFDIPQASCPDVGAFDFNCSGGIESVHREGLGGCAFAGCSNTVIWTGLAPRCGLTGPISICVGTDQQCSVQPSSMDVNFCH